MELKKQHMSGDNEYIWDERGLSFLGYWAIRKGFWGHGLLILHATAFGAKVGNMLHLKWDIFKKELSDGYVFFDTYDFEIIAGNGETLMFDYSLIKQCEMVYNSTLKKNSKTSFHDFIYTNSITGKVLTTSTLKRELQNLYKKTKNEILELTGLELNYRNIETNSFEIAWARSMVQYYRFTKQSFIRVSKRMGHRTLKDTIKLLEVEIMEDVELKFDFYDKSNYPFMAKNLGSPISTNEIHEQLRGSKIKIINKDLYETSIKNSNKIIL